MPGAKQWCWTLNNYTENDVLFFRSIVTLVPEIVYMGWGFEVGENGTPHLQGVLGLSRRKTMQRVKDFLQQPAVHLEVMHGSFDEAVEYCEKDGVFEEYGARPRGQGSRSDLIALKNDLRAGMKRKAIADKHFSNFIRYHRGINEYARLHSEPRDFASLVIVYWGPTGTGKTRAVHDNATDLWSYSADQWFDGYDGHEQVLFDDFTGSEFKIQFLLKLLDRYPMQVRIKGGFVNWRPREIYITSNLDPRTWYSGANPMHQQALMRRLSFVYNMQ